jgi:hypothetical protein
MESPQLGYWLFCSVLVLTPILVRVPFVRRTVVEAVSRLAAPEDEPLESVDEFGHFPATWYAVSRRERLLADVERLRRILATDMGMSATRQLGNRLAYDQLLSELRDLPEPLTPAPVAPAVDSWSIPTPPPPPIWAGGGDHRWQPVGNVETLDLGWRG